MISILQNEVERLRPASNELAAAVEQFLAAGGQIEEGPASGYIPKPITYSNQMPPAPKPFVRRKVESAPIQLDKADIRAHDRLKLVEKIRELGVTHTQTEVAVALGVSRRLIYKYAMEYELTFNAPTRGGCRNLVHQTVDKERDAKLAERIRAFMELGISRRKCCSALNIAHKAFVRIIADHGIDYPKSRAGGTRCAA